MINLIRICVPYLSHEPNTRRAPHGATTQARTRSNMTAAALAALLLAVAVATTAVVAPRPAQAQTVPNPPVCQRTLHIQWAILSAINGVTDCEDVTSAHLSAIDNLSAANSAERFGSVLTTLQAGDFNGMTGLQYLHLQRNSLSRLPATVFNGLTAIEDIRLQHNRLESLDKTTFNGLTNLEVIDLGDNRLRSLDKEIFSGLTNLKTVFISDNRELTSIDKAIFNGLTSLENVYLWRSGLTSLDKATFNGLSSIKEIEIQGNAIESLHKDTLSGLTTLTKFHAWGNPFGNLHKDTFNGLINLESLWLQRIGIENLDKDIFDGLNALTVIRLNTNSIASLDEDTFDGLTNLEQLWLSYNRLSSLHEDTFDGLTSLTSLGLSGNSSMKSLPADIFDGLSALEDLGMEGLSPDFVYPDGLLVGLTNLDIFYAGGPNGTPPVIFDINLIRTPGDASEAKLQIPVGAPFDMEFRMQAAGHDEGGAFLNGFDHATIPTGSIESETFNLPTVPNDDIPNFVNADRSIVIDMNLDDRPLVETCGSDPNTFSCYSGFGFSNGVLPPACSAGTASFDSARIVCEQEDQSVNNRNYYTVWKQVEANLISSRYSGIHDPVSAGSRVIDLQGLAPDQRYVVEVHGVSEDGILSMHFDPWYASTSEVEFRTAKQPSTDPPVVSVGSNSLTLAWIPQSSFQALRSEGPRDIAIQGYQVRYKKTAEAASAYSQWQTIETETTADGGQTTTLDWLFVSQLVGGELYDIQIRTITGVANELQGYSEPATTTVLTFIPVPGVNRIEPATPEISVRAGDRIRLSADIYNSQDRLDNDDAENGEGAFKRWQPELEWSSSSGAGSFDESSSGRSALYTAPSLPGVYTVTAEVGPPGLCRAHHPGVEEQDGDPCTARFTVRVSREADSPSPAPDPVNPSFAIPPQVTNDAGTVFSVFTPVEGGTFTGTGITVSAGPGAVPDRAALAVAATMTTATAPPDSKFTLHGNVYDVIAMSRTEGAEYTAVTQYRLDEPLTACLQVPWTLLDNLTNITVVEIRSDGLVGPLTSNLRTTDSATAACGRFSRVPATLAVATRADAASGATAVPTAATTQQELPEAGGSSPTVSILALVLLSGLATVAVTVAAAVAIRARRTAYTRAR